MRKKLFTDLLKEAKDFDETPEIDDDSMGDDETPIKPKEPSVDDDAPDGAGHYSADDLREIIDYVYDILEKEAEEEDDGDKDNKFEEVGLDLIYEYADVLPETVINQIVDDLKEMFEIEDTMLESIITEGAAFMKSRKGPAAQAARKRMIGFYKKNKAKMKVRNKKWRTGDHGKLMVKAHKNIYRSAAYHRKKGKRLVGGLSCPTDSMPKAV